MIPDTRRSPRVPLSAKMRVRVNPTMKETIQLAKEVVEVKVVDISALGVGVLSPTFLPQGVLVDLETSRIPLAAEGRPVKGEMHITGKVVYAKPQGSGCRIGISFTQMEEVDRLLIEQFIARYPSG